MKRWHHTLLLALVGFGGFTFGLSSCADDDLSAIGESVQPEQDKVIGRGTTITFEASTVATPTLYTDGIHSLLGEIIDHTGQPIRGEFIKQVRTAPGLTFDSVTSATRVDSVFFDIFYTSSTGDRNAAINVNIYQLAQPVTIQGTTHEDLSSYGSADRLLASMTLSPSAGRRIDGASTTEVVSTRLPSSVGQRILDASRSATERAYFATQALFDQHIFPGFYVTPTTGRGFLLDVQNIAMTIYYSTPSASGSGRATAHSKMFIDTRQTARINALTSGDTSALTAASTDYTYVKGPAGVTTRYTVTTTELQKLLATVPAPSTTPAPTGFIGRAWMLANARFSVPISPESGQLTNEPTYLLLVPSDRLPSYFIADVQEVRPGHAYLSQERRTGEMSYAFNNIAQIVTEHLARYATYSASTGWTISTPLSLDLVPVTFNQNRGSSTASIAEQISPSFVRLSKASDAMRLTFVSVQIQQ